MGGVGKSVRLKSILREDGRSLIVALDHGLGAYPVRGLENPLEIMAKVKKGGADAVITTIGAVRRFHESIPRGLGLILSIPPDPRSVRVAANLGVHAVKNTFFGPLKDWKLGAVHSIALECEDRGMPLLAEIVPTGEDGRPSYETLQVKAAAKIAAEFGADAVKTSFTGSPGTFREVVEECPIPIFILGGARMGDDRAVLENVKGAIEAGAAGVAFGRNVFQHKNPAAMTRAISRIVHEGAGVDEAMEELERP
ncbi:MAG: fructose-bisphosphate aldolase [Candidatus Brockarchaeota archaeon]|nr:fructose-bisphosphate aldolase [Candidatus Brockarchaeota archaeon]